MAGVIRRPFARLRRRRAEESEHGAVATLVAVLLAGGVLLGIGAIVIDVGQLYIEREELQTGADAASYKVALNCVAIIPACDAPTASILSTQTGVSVAYAKLNAKDKQADAQICFNGSGCPSWGTGATCPALPSPAAGTSNGSYVEVRTTTVTSTGSTLIPPSFAGALSGSSYAGKKVGACARVNWGTPLTVGKVFAMGISLCDWQRITAGNKFYSAVGALLDGTGLLPLLGLNPAAAGNDGAITKNAPISVFGIPATTCSLPLALPVDLRPRGYAWLLNNDLSPPDANCMIDVDVDDWPRTSLVSDLLFGPLCATKLKSLRNAGTSFLVPIYDTVQATLISIAPAYHIVGFAPFVATGYKGALGALLPDVGSILSGNLAPALAGTYCTGACVYGYFSKTLVSRSRPQFAPGANYGATVIGRTG